MTAPLPSNELQRLVALKEYAVLDTETEQEFDDIVELASFICGTPVSTVTFVDETRQWFKAKKGFSLSETSRNIAFCAHAIRQQELLMVNDMTKDERFADNPMVTGSPDVRFYAGMPLVTPAGYSLGTLCVLDDKPGTLSSEQQFALKVLSAQVMKLLELRKRNAELLRAHQMHTRLLSIIGHDLRGPINSIDGLLELALQQGLTQEDYMQLLPKMRQMITGTSGLLLNLLHWGKSQVHGSLSTTEKLNVREKAVDAVNGNMQLFEAKKNIVLVEIDDNVFVLGDRNKLDFVIRNLMLNANKFTSGGTITIGAKRMENNMIEVSVADTGKGMSDHTLKRIFTWGENKSSEGTDGERGSGLGIPMCKEFVEQQQGTMRIISAVGAGTTVYFTLPAAS